MPEALKGAQIKRKIFPLDPQLLNLTDNLHTTLFDSIPKLLNVLLRERGKGAQKIAQAMTDDDLQHVDEIINKLNNARRSLQQLFALLTESRDAVTATMTAKTRLEVTTIRSNQFQHHLEIKEDLRSVSRGSSRIEEKLDKMGELRENGNTWIKNLVAEMVDEMKQAKPLLNEVHQLLMGNARNHSISAQGQ